MNLSPGASRDASDGLPALDCGLLGLVLLAQFHGIAADVDQIRHQFAVGSENPLDETALLLAARSVGLKARIVEYAVERIAMATLPALSIQPDGRHFVVAKAANDKVLIQDLDLGRAVALSTTEFAERFGGRLVLVASRASVLGQLARFDFTWFIPAVVKYRRLLLEVLGVSFVLQLFALVTPLLFQVVMDKVLVHRGFTTLDVVVTALSAIVCFEIVLTTLRNYVFAHTTSRIDVELGARLFRHVLALPLAYF